MHPIAALSRDQLPLRKSQAGIRTFDDVLLTVHRAVHGTGSTSPLVTALRKRLKAAIVDECQDSDQIQIEVFRGLFAAADSFLVIGDPKQSIYRFRGADIASYQRLASNAARAAEMTTNFRSDAPLVAALNRLYSKQPEFRGSVTPRPIRYVDVTAHARAPRIFDARVHEPLLLLWSERHTRGLAKYDLAQRTAREFKRLLDEPVTITDRDTNQARRVRASDLAVLATSYSDLALMRRELQALSIPCEQAGASESNVFSSTEALDVHTWLAAIGTATERSGSLHALLAFAATPLLAFALEQVEVLRNDPLRQAELARRLSADHEYLGFHGPLPLLQRYWSDLERLQVRLGTCDGERRVTNWRHLGCLLQQQWYRGKTQARELMLWLARQRAGAEVSAQQATLKLETDSPAVQLVTVYGAKGLEYPIVCCPFLWSVRSLAARRDRDIAIVRQPGTSLLDVGSEQFARHVDDAIVQEDAEQDRLLYVALTRARHRLYLGLAPVAEGNAGHRNGAEHSALARLLGLTTVDPGQWLRRCEIVRCTTANDVLEHASAPAPVGTAEMLHAAPKLPTSWGALTRCSSYSALTRHEHATITDYDPEDRTDVHPEPGLLGTLALTGNRLGQRIHALLEDIIGNHRPLEDVVAHLDPAWKVALETILHTPLSLGPDTTTLDAIKPRSIAEMHVLLPVELMTPASLSQALLADPLIANHAHRRVWAEELADFAFSSITGFFQGYIDLIFEHQGQFYVVDYKTNALPAYDASSLEVAMLHHHYLLQARLYAVALHRHLRTTLPGYDPARHLGGCAYLFVRGFPERGVWFERAGVAALGALDSLFAEVR